MPEQEKGDATKSFVVEHLDPELEQWSALEYKTIAQECHAAGARFCLCSVPKDMELPPELRNVKGLDVEHDSVEQVYAERKSVVCLLDPAAGEELSPGDGDKFQVTILHGVRQVVVDLTFRNVDQESDRTSELRKKGFEGRRLGPVQMTTDTAVRVTRTVVLDRVPLDKISFVDHPEIRINQHETTIMPFRYVKDDDGNPVMPEGMIDLIKSDSDKGFEDLLSTDTGSGL